MSRPWMPLYVADYLADTGHLTTLEHGAYMLLIMHYWSRGSLPDDDMRLASIARATPEQWAGMRDTIAEFFNDGWKHPRIDEELESAARAYERRASAGRAGGKAKAKGKQCSSNAKAGLKQSQPQPHIEATPSGAASSAPRDEIDKISDKLLDAVGDKIQPHGAIVIGPILELIAQGVDLETDVLPVLRAKSARMTRPAGSWAYFVGAIREAYESRIAAGQGLAKPKVSPIKREEDMTEDERRIRWGKMLNMARGSEIWFTWLNGPPPGHEGCRVPADLIEPRDLRINWMEEKQRAA